MEVRAAAAAVHQRPAARLDDDGAICGELGRFAGDGFDSSAFDKHIGWKRSRTTTIPHAGTTEKNWLHGTYLLNNYKV